MKTMNKEKLILKKLKLEIEQKLIEIIEQLQKLEKPLYAIHPSFYYTPPHNKRHLSYRTLMSLYGLNSDDCIEWDDDKELSYLGRNFDNYIHLYARQDENYNLVKEIKE